ncbi:putative nuclease HARBI1 [Heterodontus francisci]|uniref:putative nuclease HARBI1 n=1 Tax=Heterodontus francisci TaxID=7792 RepID=UPI00355C3E79
MVAVDVASNFLGGHPTPVALKVTVALNVYACGSFQASTADLCGVSQAAAHHCIKVVTDALFRRADNFICFKTDNTSQAERARGVSAIAGFPMVQGVIDCTHENHAGLCTVPRELLHVDAYIFRNSQVLALLSPPDRLEGWILGDRSYPLKAWLMTPVRIPRGHAEECFNESHVATRVTIEQMIGLLRMRFRCLDRSGGSLQYVPAQASKVIVVCCALHNLAMERGDTIEEVQGNPEASSDEDGI